MRALYRLADRCSTPSLPAHHDLCTGRSPFRAATTLAVLRRVAEDQPRPIHEVNPDVPGWLEADFDALSARVLRLPERREISVPVDEQLIVEFYARR